MRLNQIYIASMAFYTSTFLQYMKFNNLYMQCIQVSQVYYQDSPKYSKYMKFFMYYTMCIQIINRVLQYYNFRYLKYTKFIILYVVYIWIMGLGMVGWTKIQQKNTWPKAHFASFIVCTMLTHDDDNMISIQSQ